jgi:hypothetical protein
VINTRRPPGARCTEPERALIGERALGVGVIWSVSAARANRFARELIRVCVRSGGGVRERAVAVITFVRHVQF